MTRVFSDGGATADLSKPLKLPVYDPSRLPDPVTCASSVIIVNDRTDGNPRPRLAVSNGASWDFYARVEEVAAQPVAAQPVAMPQIDLTPIVRNAVAQLMPPALPAPIPVTIDQSDTRLPSVAAGLLELNEIVQTMQSEIDALRQRVDFINRHALAEARITEPA